MKPFRRGVVAAALTVTLIVGVASAASAQGQPYDMPSPAMAAAGIPDATVGYRFRDQAIVVVVPDALDVDDATLRTSDQVIWNTEPVRFQRLEVRHSDQVLHRQDYDDLAQVFGKRPAGLEQSSVRELSDSHAHRALAPAWYGGRILDKKAPQFWTFVFGVACGVVAIMLVATLFVLVSAQWRRARADAKL